MAIVDIIVLAVVGLSCVFGAFRGLVKEALSLSFWIAAVVLAGMFSEEAAVFLGSSIDNAALRRVVAFVLIFVITVFVGGVVSNLVSKLTSVAGLGGVDRALGALFGIIRGVVIVTLVVMLTLQLEATRGLYGESLLVPYIMVLADIFQNLLGLAPEASVVAGINQ